MNILYLFPKKYFDHKMHRRRIYWCEALGRHRDVSIQMWGYGWPGYDESAPLQANIDRKFPQWKPDIIVPYAGRRHDGEHLGLRDTTAPRVVVFTDANHPTSQLLIDGADPTLVIFSQASDVERWPHWRNSKRQCVHLLWGANHLLYHPETVVLADRPIECLVVGVLSSPPYRLRKLAADLIAAGELRGKVRSHPGDWLDSAEQCQRQMEAYASDLRNARMVVTDGGPYGYVGAKHLEAVASGCYVIGDRPRDPEFNRRYRDLMTFVRRDIPDVEFARLLRRHQKTLASTKSRAYPLLEMKARTATQTFLYNDTLDHWAERFVSLVRKYV